MIQYRLLLAVALLGSASVAVAQQQTSVAIEGQTITVKYAAPTVKTRAIGSFHSDADLAFKGFNLPKGDYTMYVLADGSQWTLAISTAKGAKVAAYDAKLDLGRVPLTMTRPPAPAAACKITLAKTAALAAKLEVAWNDAVASTTFHLDRGASDLEW